MSTTSLLEKIIDKFQKKPETFQFLIDRNKEIAKMISEIHDKYMNLPKFSELIKEDSRKYKSFYCDSHLSSVGGFLKFLKKYKFYQLEKEDNWDLYIPRGYNNIEIDLKELKPSNEKQIIFAIPGCDYLVGKTSLWNILEDKYGREGASELLPETFVLAKDKHLELFKEKFEEGKTYILKSKRQGKRGISLTKDYKDIMEAKNKEYTLVQNYKNDLLLVNNRKLNLRIYLLLTIKNGVVEAYVNRYGTCIYSNKEYDSSTLDFENNITSYNLDLKIYDDNPMTLKQLRTYLIDHGYDNPDILFDRINEKVKLVIDAVAPKLGNKRLNDNLCVQIFGMDFLVDKDLTPFMLECNKGPDMQPKQEYKCISELVSNLEEFYENEEIVDKCYPIGYKSGNGFKVQKDIFDLLGIIEFENSINGFYKVY
jgi:hypothetical protein